MKLKSYIGKNGSWLLATDSILYYFKDGVYVDTEQLGSLTAVSGKAISVVSNNIQLPASKGNTTTSYYFPNSIDLTNYSKLTIQGYLGMNSGDSDYTSFHVRLKSIVNSGTSGLISELGSCTGQSSLVIDLTSINSSGYIHFDIYNRSTSSSTSTISLITLE